MSPISLAGRHAFVTGGARGLGLVMARALAQAGASVTITAGRSAGELAQAHAQLSGLTQGRAFAILGDVADAASCARTVDAAVAALGPVDILVNNAARGPREQPSSRDTSEGVDPWDLDAGRYAEMLVGNVASAWFMARLVVPGMVARGFGRVVNISTSRPTMDMAIGGAYGPSKAALEAQSRAWARHLEGTGVTVNLLLPGGQTDTDFIAGGRPGERPLIDWPARAGTIAEGRTPGLLPPEVMAAPIVWLASEASDGITGKRWVGANWHPALPAHDAARMAASD